MVRYSFFIFTAVFGDYSVQSDIFNVDGNFRNSLVYADESSDISSDNSVVDSSDNLVNSDSQVYVEETESIDTEQIIEETESSEEIYSQEANARSLMSSRANMGYPSSNWSFSYQNDPTTLPDTFINFRSWFKGFTMLDNDFKDRIVRNVNDTNIKLNADNLYILQEKNTQISAVYAKLTADNNILGGRIDSTNKRIDGLSNVVDNAKADLNKRINDLSNKTDNLNSNTNKRIDGLSNIVDNAKADLNKRINDLSNKTDNNNVDTNKRIDSLSNVVDNAKADLNKRINDLSIRSDNITSTINSNNKAVNLRVDNLSNKVDNINVDTNKRIDNLSNKTDNIGADLSKLALKLDADNLILGARIDMTNSNVNSIQAKVDNMEKALIAALALMNIKLDTNNEKLGLIYDRLQAYFDRDGIFTIAIREQFTRLITAHEASFWTDGKVEENAKDGSFVKLLKALIYSMRYGLIAEFSDFTKVFKEQMKLSRDNFVQYIDLVNQNLVTSIGWLKLIYEKKTIIEIPPISVFPANPFIFDYDRLQKMFDGIDFGSITNEAGKNIWDFLSELVKAVADLAIAILGLVEALADKIIELFVPENFDFIDEGFEQISESFDNKFKFAIDVGSDILKIFNVPQVKFSDQSIKVDAFDMNMEIPLQFSLINDFAVYVRGLITAFILIYNLKYIYGRIVGEGDII